MVIPRSHDQASFGKRHDGSAKPIVIFFEYMITFKRCVLIMIHYEMYEMSFTCVIHI